MCAVGLTVGEATAFFFTSFFFAALVAVQVRPLRVFVSFFTSAGGMDPFGDTLSGPFRHETAAIMEPLHIMLFFAQGVSLTISVPFWGYFC